MPRRSPPIRPMQVYDLPAVAALEKQCFAQPWSLQMLQHDLCTNGCARYLVMEQAGVIVGYAGMWVTLGEAHVVTLAVAPHMRRRGYAAALLRALFLLALDRMDIVTFTLEVRVGNKPALHLYERIGFRVEGIEKNYYEDGEDAYIMYLADTRPALKRGDLW